MLLMERKEKYLERRRNLGLILSSNLKKIRSNCKQKFLWGMNYYNGPGGQSIFSTVNESNFASRCATNKKILYWVGIKDYIETI